MDAHGQREGLARDDVLDNITLFWLTNTAVSAARLYWENKLAFFTPKNVKIPVAVSVFLDELYPTPRNCPLQQARQGQALCSVGTAATAHGGDSRRLQTTARLPGG